MVARAGEIFLAAADREGFRAHETVTAAGIPAVHVGDPKRDDPAVENGKDPVDGSRKAELLVGPAHRFSEGQLSDDPGQNFREEALRGLAADRFPRAEVFPFFRRDPIQSGDVDSLTFCEAERRTGGVSLFVEGNPHGRPELLDHLILLAFSDAVHRPKEPAGGSHRHGLSVRDSARCQLPAADLVEIPEGFRQKSSRDLFRSDFEEQFAAHKPSPILLTPAVKNRRTHRFCRGETIRVRFHFRFNSG